jgi:hypothetical protein
VAQLAGSVNNVSQTSQGKIIQINEEQVKGHLNEVVRGTVEEMLNACWMPKQSS